MIVVYGIKIHTMNQQIKNLWSSFLQDDLSKRKPKNRELTPEEIERNKLASSLRGVNSRPSEITTEGKLLLMWKSGFVEVGKANEMVDFILEMDWLTTTEFCEKYNVPQPEISKGIDGGVKTLLQIDTIKQRMFVEKAKEIKNLKN